MMRSTCVAFPVILCIFLGLGCSAGEQTLPTTPASPRAPVAADSSHSLWGLWQFRANPEAGTLDVVPMRDGAMHVNVISLLEPPAGMKLKIANLTFVDKICDVDVSLVHPFAGLSQYIGFDVAGIFISKGTLAGFSDPDLVMPGPGESRLLNPDGYTRWWNPVEFSGIGAPIFRYRDGLLGVKDEVANFDCTLNAYKLFGDGLGKDDDILTLGLTSRVPFLDGSINTRHYKIDFAGGMVFNYAVDSNWELPAADPPLTPIDYAPEANRPEAWAVSITQLENSLWNNGAANGGDLSLLIDVWDHYNADENEVWVESPGNFPPAMLSTPIGGGDGYARFQLDIVDATPKAGSIDLLIGVESEVLGYWDVLQDDPVAAYFTRSIAVGPAQTKFPPNALMHATTSTDISVDGSVSFDATDSTGTPPLTFTWDFNGDGTFGGPADSYVGAPETPTHTFDKVGSFNVRVKVVNLKGFDISDPVMVKVGLDPNDTYVDGDYPGSDSNGSPAKPFKTIQDGMNAVTAGHKLHVDYLDSGTNVYDTGGLSVKGDIQLLGDNWNGGGPGKPKVDTASNTTTLTVAGSNLTIEGFEIGFGEAPANPSHYGINSSYSSCNNVTIRHNKFTDDLDDTGLIYGVTMPLHFASCNNSLVELNDVGPINWHSDTSGEYARVLWGMYFDSCSNIEVKNNFIHDFTIDYQGDGVSWGQIRMFCLHCYVCTPADVHNNLISHIKGINTYDYRIEGMMAEGYSGGDQYHYYNNTIDGLDHSQSNGGFPLRGIFVYAGSAPGTFVNNTLITYFNAPNAYSGSMQVYYSVATGLYNLTYSTGYHMGTTTNYFSGWNLGDGATNYPGIDPKYVNHVTQPYDYRFDKGSFCEFGDPNFIDWDDTGAPSGDPTEPNIQNRSRMGCFGGPDGDWDPNDL